MSLTIAGATAALNTARTNLANVPPGVRDGVKALGQALRADDLPAARQAYVELVKQAPKGASFQPGSPFSDIGKALVTGDLGSAKTSYKALLKAQVGRNSTEPVPPPAPINTAPTVSSTGGNAGGTLNAVA